MSRFVLFDDGVIVNLDGVTHIRERKNGVCIHFSDGKDIVMIDWKLEEVMKVIREEDP